MKLFLARKPIEAKWICSRVKKFLIKFQNAFVGFPFFNRRRVSILIYRRKKIIRCCKSTICSLSLWTCSCCLIVLHIPADASPENNGTSLQITAPALVVQGNKLEETHLVLLVEERCVNILLLPALGGISSGHVTQTCSQVGL